MAMNYLRNVPTSYDISFYAYIIDSSYENSYILVYHTIGRVNKLQEIWKWENTNFVNIQKFIELGMPQNM